MSTIPDDLIVKFFQVATAALDGLPSRSLLPSLSDDSSVDLSAIRRVVLNTQLDALTMVVAEYNQDSNNHDVTLQDAQQCLANMGARRTTTEESLSDLSVKDTTAMANMEEAARQAVCRLAIWSEAHQEVHKRNRQLQTDGKMERSILIEFIALCQTAIRLDIVKKYIIDGSALFNELPPEDSDEMPTAMKFPQARLERIQCYISRAVGWDPAFTTRELRRIFGTDSEYANDKDVTQRFEHLVGEMSALVSSASLQASVVQLSDFDKGGVTRVLSVNCSEVVPETRPGDHPINSSRGSSISAPLRETMNPEETQEEQRQQIRMASKASRLQREIMDELTSMDVAQREVVLEKAKATSETFVHEITTLPPGPERIAYLQSIDPEVSKLLAMHKIWTAKDNA